jgi:ribonuclease P protein component
MAQRRNSYPAKHRLGGKKQFSAVFDAKIRQSRGFLTIYARPNEFEYSRLGISISRKVGTAPRRNRIKRLLRESFRLGKQELPSGYDWVIVVRPHDPTPLGEYQRLLLAMMGELHKRCAGC